MDWVSGLVAEVMAEVGRRLEELRLFLAEAPEPKPEDYSMLHYFIKMLASHRPCTTVPGPSRILGFKDKEALLVFEFEQHS